MSGGGNKVGDRHGIVVQARRDKARVMGHIDHQLGMHFVGDLRKLAVGDFTGIGTRASDDQLGAMFAGQAGDLVEVDAVRLLGDAVAHEAIQLAG